MTEALTLRLADAEQELAEIASAQDAQQLADKAAAAAEFARRVKLGNSAINHATTIRVLAERRMAQLVDEGQKAGQIATTKDTLKRGARSPDPGERAASLDDLEIDSRRLAEARKLARDYTEDEIRDRAARATDDGNQMSRQALLNQNAKLPLSAETNEWYTPPQYVEAARLVLGEIDLDPASSDAANQTVNAGRYYTKAEDGLTQPWKGRVWLNPPYGRKGAPFVERLCDSVIAGDVSAAIVLVNSNGTDTGWFRPLWEYTLCFAYRRIQFLGGSPDSTDRATHGSVFVYFGPDMTAFAEVFAPIGAVVRKVTP